MKWRDRKIETIRMRVGDIQPHPMNPKIHPAGQLAPLRGLLETVGKLDDLKAYRSERAGGALVFFDGHGRRELDPDAEWDVDIYDLTDAEADLAVATFDPIGWQAEQSRAQLDALLREVSTGDAALQKLLSDVAEESGLYFGNEPQAPGAGGDDFDTTPEETQTRVVYGDLWQCDEHRVLCGDSTKAEDVAQVMAGEKADMVFTDPPYGMRLDVDYDQMFTADDRHRKTGARFDSVKGDHSDFSDDLIKTVFRNFDYCDEVFLWGADYYYELLPAAKDGSWIVWDKRCDENMDRVAGNVFELCWSKSKHKRMIARILWSGHHGLAKDDTTRRVHPTQKPLLLVLWFFEHWGSSGHVVVDVYGGSGTTLIACERTNRKARLIEIEPKYVNVILSRWEAETGKQAQLLERLT